MASASHGEVGAFFVAMVIGFQLDKFMSFFSTLKLILLFFYKNIIFKAFIPASGLDVIIR